MNKLILPQDIDNAPRVPFNALRVRDRYRHTPAGSVHQVYAKPVEGDHITIKRADGWLIRCDKGGYCWDKGVIKV